MREWQQAPSGPPDPYRGGGVPPGPPGYGAYPATGPPGYYMGYPLAGWWRRAGGYLLDRLILAVSLGPGITLVALGVVENQRQEPDDAGRILLGGALILVAWAVTFYNKVWLQGTTGQSWGKQVARTRLVRLDNGHPLGFGTNLLRQFLRVVFGVVCFLVELLSFLWPLWDERRQTFEDMLVSSLVIMDQEPQPFPPPPAP